jgi:PPE-repeat protein
MTAPVWMAFPPEVHSALLSTGPGPGSLLAAAEAWTSLSSEYASAAEELSSVLAAVQAGVWEGPSAESYLAAHVPYLAWLMQASVNSAAAAAQHATAAAAFGAALAAMPTLAELAANHATHAVLVATNFFGINTIPIALNEADYVRMWVQAATTMGTYQAVSGSAVAAAPQTSTAPQILKTASATTTQTGTQSTGLGDLLAQLLQKLGVPPQIVSEFGIDNIYDFLNNPVSYTETHLISRLLTDPLSLLVNPLYVFFDGDEAFFPLGYAFLPASAVGLASTGVGSVGGLGGLAGLAGLAGIEPAVEPPIVVALEPVAAEPNVLPVAGTTPTLLASTAAPPAPPPAPAPMTSTVPVSSPPPAPPPAAPIGPGFVPPYAVGPPGIGFDSQMTAGAKTAAKRKAPEPDSTAAAATAAAREQRRARRRRRAHLRDHADEFADMNIDVDPDWGGPLASGNGAGPLGFAGTVRNETAAGAVGLTTLAGHEFGGAPAEPMVPGSWGADGGRVERSGQQND